MSGIGFSGIASGIDFQSLVNQIISAETRPINLVEDQVTATQARMAAWTAFQGQLGALRTSAAALRDPALFSRMTATVPSGTSAVRTSVSGPASAGRYQLQVDRLATAERLGSRGFSSALTPLGLEGDFRVGGQAISVGAGDTLSDIASRINQSGGANRGASANLISSADGSVRLVLTGTQTGAAGLELADGPGGVLQELGLLSGTTRVRTLRSDGVAGGAFRDASTPLSELVGTGAGAGTVRFGSVQVALDLQSQTLQEVADAINTASSGAGARVSARVDTRADGQVELVVQGTTDVEDNGGVLEALGVVARSRNPVARRLEGAAFTTGGVAASGTTLLSQLDGFDGNPAGTATGDTLTLQGVRGDGSTFSTTVALDGTSTLQDVLDALNAGDAFGGGDRTASATLDAQGRIVLTDGTAGGSGLALSMVAHNETGGTLSPGGFTVAERGHAVVLTAGRDAEGTLDGIRFTSASNALDGVIEGVGLQLTGVTTTPVEITVAQDRAGAANAVQAMVTAYNAVVDFIQAQGSGPSTPGSTRPALSADGVLRSMQGQLRSAMSLPLLPAGSPFTTLSDVGVSINRTGRYDFNRATFESALTANPQGVSQLFSARSASQASEVQVGSFTPGTAQGSWGVQITRAASRALSTGADLSGGYPADASPDRMMVRDLAGGGSYGVSLEGGMTAQAIADALNSAFATPLARRVELPAYNAPGGTPADAGTLLTDLEDADGTPLGIVAGQTLTVSGTTATGSAFVRTLTVGEPGGSTLADLSAFVGGAVGSTASVTLENGRLRLESGTPGTSALQVAISVSAPDDSVISLGPTEVIEPGRGRARIEASVVNGAVSLTHLEAGSASGFELTFESEGVDHTAVLGFTAGVVRGEDVEGTIGGHPATGAGEQLRGSAGSPVAGLALQVSGTALGDRGTVEVRRGVGAAMENTLRSFLDDGPASIPGLLSTGEAQITRLNTRIEDMETRLERRREALILRFTAMEEAIARAQSQSAWLTSQLGALPTTQRNS